MCTMKNEFFVKMDGYEWVEFFVSVWLIWLLDELWALHTEFGEFINLNMKILMVKDRTILY